MTRYLILATLAAALALPAYADDTVVQVGGQTQSQSVAVQASGNSSNTVQVGGPTVSAVGSGNTLTYERPHRDVASAIATSLVLSDCSRGASGAVQTGRIGFSFGGAKPDKACQVNNRAALLGQLGYAAIALDYLAAQDPDLARVLAAQPKSAPAAVHN